MDKGFKTKVITALVLCGCIVLGLIYLIVIRVFTKGSHEDVLPTVTPTSIPEVTPTPTVEPTPTPVIYDTTSDDSLYRIVNEDHPIGEEYVPDNLVTLDSSRITVSNVYSLREDAYNDLLEMYDAASLAGLKMRIISGYRSYSEQVTLYEYYKKENGEAWAEEIDDKPGLSEHQLGLCVDIGIANGNCDLNACFADTSLYTWLKENAYKYGYIERYPENKQDITGVIYSPWHYRYIGKELAKKVYDSGLTLEEYFSE